MVIDDPAYGVLATRVTVSNLHKETLPEFSATMRCLHRHEIQLVSDELMDVVREHGELLDAAIDYQRDYDFDYFGIKTLEKAYLIRVDNVVAERPQHMFMRVALGVHGRNVERAIETYDLMSRRFFVHATPTLFNAGTPHPQNSSCYLVGSTPQAPLARGLRPPGPPSHGGLLCLFWCCRSIWKAIRSTASTTRSRTAP